NHIIQYEIFEIEGCTRVRAVELQNRVSRMAGEGVKRVMEEVMERLAGPGSLVKIDRLQLDMGVIPYEGFEEHFLERLAEVLEKELSILLAAIRPVKPGVLDSPAGEFRVTRLELLEYFLVK